MSTVGTSLPAHPMLGNLQSKLRQIRNLTALVGGNAFDLCQILATAGTDIGIMEDGILGFFGKGEGATLEGGLLLFLLFLPSRFSSSLIRAFRVSTCALRVPTCVLRASTFS
jgi:hypothetical protein